MHVRIEKDLVKPLVLESDDQDRSCAKITNHAVRAYLTNAGHVIVATKKPKRKAK